MKSAKGILINVENGTIENVMVDIEDGNHLKSMYKHIKCDLVELIRLPNDNDLWVNEEGLVAISDDTKFFRFEDAVFPICGNGLLLGSNPENGETIDTKLTIEEVKGKVKFLSLKEAMSDMD